MKRLDFDWQINEFMFYCRSTQLREKSMARYEQALRLFERWCAEELRIFTGDELLNEAETIESPFAKTTHINISFPLTFLHLYDKISL